MISSGCVTHLREMFLKDHAVEVSFLGIWCIVWIHMLCMFQHAICHLHTKFCIPPSCLNFVFKNNWNYDQKCFFFFKFPVAATCAQAHQTKEQKINPIIFHGGNQISIQPSHKDCSTAPIFTKPQFCPFQNTASTIHTTMKHLHTSSLI
jgi:hypothetical protein